ncbi:MAG: glycosyltransferase family 87 protein [Planctomycetota bacterium]
MIFVTASIFFAGYRASQRYAFPSKTFDFSNSGMSDFHNGAYFPSKAFRDGVNPYSLEVCERYPMARSTPPYSPVVFLLYLPLTWLDLPFADIVFFAVNVGLMGWLAWFCVGMIRSRIERQSNTDALLEWFGSDFTASLWLFGWMMFSRPGHITIFTGYFTLQLVIGTVLAMHFARTRPWISAIGMLLASGKPTYIIPLVILMLARKQFRAVGLGLALCAVVAAGGLGWLAWHADFQSVVAGIQEGQEAFDNDPTEDPVNTWTRLDTMGVVAKLAAWKPDGTMYLAGMLVLLAPVSWLLWNSTSQAITSDVVEDIAERDPTGASNSSGIDWQAHVCYLALLISIYHHSYDALLASVSWAALVLGGSTILPGLVSRWLHRALVLLLTIPAVNYVATLRFRDLMGVDNQSVIWNAVTSLNGVCLLSALILLMWVGWNSTTRSNRG